jgi:hypothetical protein
LSALYRMIYQAPATIGAGLPTRLPPPPVKETLRVTA